MDRMEKPTVVIPTRNEEKNLPNVLADLMNQTMECAIVVVDGLSEDATVEIAKEYGAKTIPLKSSVGWARHMGTLHADSEFILQTDADARLPDFWVERHCKHLDTYFVVTGPIMYKEDSRWSLFNPAFLFGQHLLMSCEVSCVAANLSYRRSKYVGFRDKGYGEDMDFLSRMIAQWGPGCHHHDNGLAVYNNHYPMDWWARELGILGR